MIKSQEAFEQHIDFSGLLEFCKSGTDVDSLLHLHNSLQVSIEVKKDTPNHVFEVIHFTKQWLDLETWAGIDSNRILIYATHNQKIDRNVNIRASECIVKRVQRAGFTMPEFNGKRLYDVIQDLNKLESLYKYRIEVVYPNLDKRFCVVKNWHACGKWITDTYNPTYQDIETLREAENYILERWNGKVNGEYINRGNQYIISRQLKDSESSKWEIVKRMTWA